jgi:hypothetical protein
MFAKNFKKSDTARAFLGSLITTEFKVLRGVHRFVGE